MKVLKLTENMRVKMACQQGDIKQKIHADYLEKIGDGQVPTVPGIPGEDQMIKIPDEMKSKDTFEMPCIRCTKCVEVCPAQLQPQELYWHAKSKQFEKLTEDYKLFDCIECGCCSYVCPSNIPLVQYYRFAKSEIRDQLKSSEVADIARERNEFRLYRLEREKKERAERNAQRRAQTNDSDKKKLIEEKKAAIAEAMKRIEEKGK